MDAIQMVEALRKELLQQINTQCDALLQLIQSGADKATGMEQRLMEVNLMFIEPFRLKGKKPISLKFADGRQVEARTWKKVVLEILQHCNQQPVMHERLMQLSGKVAGRQRIILGHTPEGMDVPLQIDEQLYFEAKFDTETLIKILTEKVLKVVGYDYSQIKISYQG